MGFPGGSAGKESACQCRRRKRRRFVPSLDREDPLEKEMVIHSSVLAWKVPWTEESGGLQSLGSQNVRHDWLPTHTGTKSLWPSISILYQTPASFHLGSSSLTLLWSPWLLSFPFQVQPTDTSHHRYPHPGLLCYPLRSETMRVETGTHTFVTQNAEELTYLGLTFGDGRW